MLMTGYSTTLLRSRAAYSMRLKSLGQLLVQSFRRPRANNSFGVRGFRSRPDMACGKTAYQHPVMRTVAWANGADLAPEFLLELMRHQQEQAA